MNDTTTMIAGTAGTDIIAAANVYFTFFLGDGTFAVDVQTVKEVLTYESVTRVPRTADYMRGVMNVRGTVVSVIDFRTLFNIVATVEEEKTSIIVAEVVLENEQPLVFGFIADGVEGVSELDEEIQGGIESHKDSPMRNQFIKRLGRKDGKFVLILDMEKILAHVETELSKIADK